MREAMASFLEPDADTDRKVAICRSAVTLAVLDTDFSEAARGILLEQWIGSRNLSREDFESFAAYLPASIASYLRLVERFWTTRRHNHQAEGILVRAFFRWQNNARVQQALVAACEKWLSYVHPYGYRFMRGRDDQSRAKLRREIEERAGRPLKAGSKFKLVDELEVIESDDLLWLSEPALLLASLFPVAPFVPALRRWALGRSVMGYPDEGAVVACVLRWTSEDAWPPLEAAVRPLLDGPLVAQQAAYRLLWSCGREEAARVLERLPENLFPPSYDEQAYAEDPCLPSWRREDCAMCAARPNLPHRLVALKLAPHALDPDFRIDLDLRPRLEEALSGLRKDQLSSGSEMTVDDGDLRRMEPALAAFAPDLLVRTYLALVRDLPNRSQSRQVLLSELDGLVLILTPAERHVLEAAWDQLLRAEPWDDETRHAEIDLFGALLFHASARRQLDLLLRRPKTAFEDHDLGLYLKRLQPNQVHALAQSLRGAPAHEIKWKLWYLWYQPAAPVVEALGIEELINFLDHPDREIQSIAADWLFLSGSEQALKRAIERGKITPAWTRSLLHDWGRWFNFPALKQLSYATLAKTLDLGLLSYLVRRRPRDLASYARDLDRAVRASVVNRNETLRTDFCKATLGSILKRDREVIEAWVQLAVGQQNTRSSLIESCHMLLEPLCEVLLEEDPVRGAELFRALLSQRRRASTLDSPTGVDLLALTLFRVPQSEHSDGLLWEWFQDCNTDMALFELALASSAAHNHERLRELIRQGLSSPAPVKKAAALMLAGFTVHSSDSAALLDSVQFHPEGWLWSMQAWARRHLERDRWAQEWFRRFCTSQSTDESFAAFRLLLRCVDRRYWVWKYDVLKSIRLPSLRRRYLTVNRHKIDEAIMENEKNLEKRFLGRDIPEGKVHPWLGRYGLAS